ncbi:hypothetical protein GOP47_0024113 [Adiantum capillus-veneris]|uniref:Glycosyltransferase n=1 Tax=Adiantum capillus-veneris TaxID=13818 RepID=A0A9D4U5Z3_ADICA|nr:hypothetical protein GOP47_0024113 [Adiantum capillus-veneris]
MDIARKLASLGVSITFVCTEGYIGNMIKQGFNPGGLPIRLVGLPDGLPPEKSMTDSVDQINVLIEVTEKLVPSLEDLLCRLNEEDRIACVLYDFMLWWMGRLGQKLGMPTYIFYAMSASFFSYLTYIPELVSQGRLPLEPHTDLNDESIIFKIPGFPSLHAREVPDISWSPNALCSFDYTMRSTAAWRDATGILFNTVYDLEKEVIDDLRERAPEMDIRAVGPLLPLEYLSAEMAESAVEGTKSVNAERCLRWLDEQPEASVLYIAFGTIASPSVQQLHELAMGLEASKARFVWVVSVGDESNLQDDGAEDDIVDDGDEKAMKSAERKGKQMNDGKLSGNVLPSGFEERTQGKGLVLWQLAPQRKILAHGAIGGFLTHCGWNSTLEGMCKGVPLLCCPMFGDQGMNGKWVEEVVHTGKRLQLQRDEVQRQVQQLVDMSSPLRLSACRLRDIACRAALPGGSSHIDLHAFIQNLE